MRRIVSRPSARKCATHWTVWVEDKNDAGIGTERIVAQTLRIGYRNAAAPSEGSPRMVIGLNLCGPPRILLRNPLIYAFVRQILQHNCPVAPPDPSITAKNGTFYGLGAILRTYLSRSHVWLKF
jgi:hypothetical protein